MAFTIIHEAQHSDPIVGKELHLADERTFDDKPATGLFQIQTELADKKKQLNPQNYAFFALFVCFPPS